LPRPSWGRPEGKPLEGSPREEVIFGLATAQHQTSTTINSPKCVNDMWREIRDSLRSCIAQEVPREASSMKSHSTDELQATTMTLKAENTRLPESLRDASILCQLFEIKPSKRPKAPKKTAKKPSANLKHQTTSPLRPEPHSDAQSPRFTARREVLRQMTRSLTDDAQRKRAQIERLQAELPAREVNILRLRQGKVRLRRLRQPFGCRFRTFVSDVRLTISVVSLYFRSRGLLFQCFVEQGKSD
jgi:hypothetical protein